MEAATIYQGAKRQTPDWQKPLVYKALDHKNPEPPDDQAAQGPMCFLIFKNKVQLISR